MKYLKACIHEQRRDKPQTDKKVFNKLLALITYSDTTYKRETDQPV